MRSIPVLVVLFLTLATPAFASDGVLEINQTCATQTGCFAGDTPGFPVTITGSAPARSFRLTSDLGPLSASQTAVDATQVGATIDLGGFRIYGPSVCTGVPVTACTPAATGFGVDAGPNSVVTNGTISGMGKAVRLGYSGRLSQVNAFSNGEGLLLGNESIVEGNLATSNGASGISCSANCIVRGNTATGNGARGIELPFGSGIVSDNTANSNGDYGISAGPGAAVQRNIMRSNTGYGLWLNLGTYRENTINDNTLGTVNGGAINMGGNSCNATLTCP